MLKQIWKIKQKFYKYKKSNKFSVCVWGEYKRYNRIQNRVIDGLCVRLLSQHLIIVFFNARLHHTFFPIGKYTNCSTQGIRVCVILKGMPKLVVLCLGGAKKSANIHKNILSILRLSLKQLWCGKDVGERIRFVTNETAFLFSLQIQSKF